MVMIRETAKLPFMFNIPTPDEINPPMPICINPSNADALPAFLENGERAMAAAFG